MSLQRLSHFNVKDDFITQIGNHYGSAVFNCDLSSDKTKQEINNWCNDNTGGLIPDFLKSNLPLGTQISLFNALYFKSSWTVPFKKENTTEGTFNNADWSTSRVSMMKDKINAHAAYDADGATWVALSFGNTAYQMVLVLPDKRTDLTIDSYMANISEDELTEVIRRMTVHDLKITLPKFRINSDISLNRILESMGMEKSFSSDADFSGISDDALSVSTASQSVTFEIDEKGAEAAAVTIIPIGPTANIEHLPYKELVFDHPFAFFIREQSTSAIIFAGRINML